MKFSFTHITLVVSLLFWGLFSYGQTGSLAVQNSSPYVEELVRFSNGEASLSGTLIYPNGGGSYPAVVLISGSGPHDRDQNILGFKSFAILADHLCRNGIAVLRYDDRAVGESTGPTVLETTSAELGEDAMAGFQLLVAHPSVKADKIGLIGHSEGGLIAPIMAAKYPAVDFIVLLAGPVVNGKESLNRQLELILTADGATPKEVTKSIALQEEFFAALETDLGWEPLRKKLFLQSRQILEQSDSLQIGNNLSDTIEYLLTQTEAAIAAYNNPWFRYFISHEPASALSLVSAPVLAIYGERDTQVHTDQQMPVLIRTLELSGNNDFQVETIPKANHLFQVSKSGSPSEYGTLKNEFAPGLLQSVTSWILLKTSY